MGAPSAILYKGAKYVLATREEDEDAAYENVLNFIKKKLGGKRKDGPFGPFVIKKDLSPEAFEKACKAALKGIKRQKGAKWGDTMGGSEPPGYYLETMGVQFVYYPSTKEVIVSG